MSITTISLLLIVTSVPANSLIPEDARLNFTELSIKYGHSAEEHRVTTADGYILTLFRIPGKKPPVLLLHGLIDCSDTFIIRGNSSLAITLANKGYDTWAANTRGNKYARQHTKLNPDTDLTFWDYSFHDHGYYDLPAIIDYILNATGHKTLKSIGHSEGTTDHFVLGSLRPEYNEKIQIFIAMAPSVFFKHLTPPLSLIIGMGPLLDQVSRPFEIEELFREGSIEKIAFEEICNRNAVFCRELLFQVGGHDPKRLERDFLSVLFGHFPTSGSRKGLIHYNQLGLRKRFGLFDYGAASNLKRYRQTEPPDYNLTQFSMKTALFAGNNDLICDVKDVEYLRTVLPNVVEYHLMDSKRWNHYDFVWGNDMQKTLYPYILKLLEKF
ncbi:lipase 1-like [Cydia pomonella]|uniref:lipase 1-like n=1 Tax=Cydia pomonella TaxID=82600 RepID=UPI002ADE0593|nr:lipase 1-like [Cydia pomonella]